MSKSKLLYIVSMGHSGSTLLDLICGTIPKAFSMGEMHFLSWQLKQGEVKNDLQTYCSCGKYFDECVFWSPILKELEKENHVDLFKHPEHLDFSLNRGLNRYKRYRVHNILNKLMTLSYTFALFNPLRRVVYLYYKKSIKNIWDLYDKVAERSKSTYVIDSSKNIKRALLLKMMRPDDVKILVLKRDVKGVSSSSHYGLSDSLVRERTREWIRLYYKKIPSYLAEYDKKDFMEIQYEDLCTNYNQIRKDIAMFIGLDDHMHSIEYISPYKYHTVQGNPMRLKKEDLAIRYDERWKKRLTKEQKTWIENQLVLIDG